MADNVTKIILTAEDRTAGALNAVKGSIGGIAGAAASLGVALSAGGIAAFVKSTIDAADNLNDLSQRLGVGVKQLAGYQLAAQQSGTSLESVAKGIKALSTYAAQNGDSLKKLGIDTKDADKAMVQLADVFAALPDGMQKSALATKIFGKAGQDLIPLMNGGSAAMQKAQDTARVYGERMSALAPQADKFNDTMSELKLGTAAFGLSLTSAVLPVLNTLADELNASQKGSTDAASGFSLLAETLKTVVVFGANVGYVVKQTGVELGGMAAQLNALAHGDVQGFKAIREAMVNDADAARKKIDDFSEAVLNARAATSQFNSGAQMGPPLTADTAERIRQQLMGQEAAAKAAEASDRAYQSLMKTLREKLALEEAEAKNGQPLSDAQKTRVDMEAKLDEVLGKSNPKKREAAEALIQMLAATQANNDANAAWLKFQQDADNANRDRLQKITDQADALELEAQTYGLTKSQIEQTTVARLEEARAIVLAKGATDEQLKALDEEIAARKRVVDAMATIEAKDTAKKQADEAAKAWEKFADEINQSLTDALMRGFEDGKSFGKNFVDSLKNTLKTAALKIVVQAIVNPVTGAISGANGGGVLGNLISGGGIGGGSSAASLFTSASSIWNAISPDSLGSNAYSSFAGGQLGKFLGLSTAGTAPVYEGGQLVKAGTGSGIGGTTLTSTGQMVADFLPYVPAIAKLVQGDTKDAAVTAAGTYIGSLFGAPYLGSLIGGWFGAKSVQNDPHNNPAYAGLILSLDKNGIGAGSTTIVGGPTSGKGWWGEDRGLSAAQRAAINAMSLLTFAQGDALAKRIGVDPALAANASISTADAGMRVGLGRSFASLDEAMTALSNSIIKNIIPNFADIQKSGETLTDMMSRLTQEFDFTESIARMQGKSGSALFGNITNRDSLVQLFGGLGGAQTSIGNYAGNYYTQAEQVALGKANISATLKGLGISDMPETRAQFRALVDAQDLTTDAGRRMYASLIAVSDAFAGITQSADDAAAALAANLRADQFKTRADYVFAQKTGKVTNYDDGFGVASNLAGGRGNDRAERIALVQAMKVIERLARRWEADGMPPTRTV